jgi:hypothetical protein
MLALFLEFYTAAKPHNLACNEPLSAMLKHLKERLLALVRDLFTFSSKVIKMFILV